MGLFDWLGGKSDFKEPFERRELINQSDQSRGKMANLLNNIISRGKQATDEPRLTAKDLFGEQMQRIFDSARSGANATKQALSRAMMGGGGDVSGAAGARLLGVNQATNEQIGETGLKFSRLADQINRQAKARGDQLLTQGMQGLQNIFQIDENRLQQNLQREIQREQARKQRGAGVLGGILNVAGNVAQGAIAACWVAEELYGEDNPKVAVIRAFLFENEGKPNKYGKFYDEYKEEGRKWAMMVRDDKTIRLKAKTLFDELYEIAKAA